MIKERDVLVKEIPHLKENLSKSESKLCAVQKSVKVKVRQLNQASAFTERRLAELISLNPNSLDINPDLVPLLAILQERDNFSVDTENEVIK